MRSNINRRQFLAGTMAAAGWCLAGRLPHGFAAETKKAWMPEKDLSATAPSLPVAIQRCESYEPQLLRARVDESLKLIGGIKDLVNGKTVTIKINVTGGPGDLGGLPGYRTYHIHYGLLAAVCAAISDAGATRIVIVESQYSPKTPEEVYGAGGWDINAIKAAGNHKVTFEDTRNRGAFPAYSTLKVPWGGFLFPAFMVNQRYEKTDVLVSLSKLKDHLCAGTTGSIKNLFGITPTSLYGHDSPKEDSLSYRGPCLHNGQKKVPDGVPADMVDRIPENHWKYRVPRVTADILGARPVDLAIVDGIETNRGGEGPWAKGVEPLAPKLLIAGRNAVCADAICAAAQGYNPLADHFEFPYPGENHLKLLAHVGVGTNDPKRIEVRGLPLEKAIFPFNPKKVPLDYPTAYNHLHKCGGGLA